MRRVESRIERLEKAHRVSQTVAPNLTVVFIDVDGVVRSELRLVEGRREWVRYDEGDPAK
jgi:hypothetical protein